jgi:hypothetical protein
MKLNLLINKINYCDNQFWNFAYLMLSYYTEVKVSGFKKYNNFRLTSYVLRDTCQLNDFCENLLPIFCSPYQLKVRPRVEPDQVKVEGPGVSGKGIPASLPAEFTIDTSQAGYGDLEVQVKVSKVIKILKLKY